MSPNPTATHPPRLSAVRISGAWKATASGHGTSATASGGTRSSAVRAALDLFRDRLGREKRTVAIRESHPN